MLRKVVDKKTAVQFAALLIGVVLILSLWPFRLWKTDKTLAGAGQIIAVSEAVQAGEDAGEIFTASYSHLQSIKIYIADVETEGSVALRLFGTENGQSVLVAQEELALTKEQAGSYVTVELDVDLTPGEIYTCMLDTEKAVFHVGFEAADGGVAEGLVSSEQVPGYVCGFYHDTTVDGVALASGYTYRMPLQKFPTACLMLALAVLTALIWFGCRRYYDSHPEKNGLFTIEKLLRVTLTPVILAVTAVGLIAAGPMQLFDHRIGDILFYELGILLAALIALYGLWHDRSAVYQKRYQDHHPHGLFPWLQAVCIAAQIGFCCEYVNALYDLQHTLAERKMMIAFLLVILFSYRREELLNLRNILYTIIALVAGAVCYAHYALDASQKEYTSHNLALGLLIAVVILFGLVLINTVQLLAADWRQIAPRKRAGRTTRDGRPRASKKEAYCAEEHKVQKSNVYLLFLTVLFLFLVILRNTRWWTVVFVLSFTLFYIRFYHWKGRRGWLTTLSRGVCLQFICMVIYCLLHRYFMSFLYTRYSMDFHTVTITAVYLTMVEAAALVLFLGKWQLTVGCSFKERLAILWKEALLLGIASSYLLMTMSRTGVMAVAAVAFVLLAAILFMQKRAKILLSLAAMIAVTVLTFPVIFTGQRILPVVVGEPKLFEIESYPDEVMRGSHWDSMYYICLERFSQVFGAKMFGLPEGSYDFYGDSAEEESTASATEQDSTAVMAVQSGHMPEQGKEAAGNESAVTAGTLTIRAQKTVASAAETVADDSSTEENQNAETTDQQDEGDYTNGRLSIYRSYLEQMNLWGHDGMGAVLEDGSIAMHAHNVFLQVAFDHGVLAGIWFALFLFLTFLQACLYYKRCLRSGRLSEAEKQSALLPLAAVTAFGAAGMVEWVFTLCNPMTIFLFYAIAPLLKMQKKGNRL